VIDALKSCSDGDTKQIQRQNIVAVGNGLDASLQYFCKDSGNKLNREFFGIFVISTAQHQ
jgi:hypothetical protein